MADTTGFLQSLNVSLFSCFMGSCLDLIGCGVMKLFTVAGVMLGILAGGVGCSSQMKMPKNTGEASSSGLTITYIGSSGYLIETENKKIMVDAAFDNFVETFEVTVPSEEVRARIAKGEAPYNRIDLFLVTHSHRGHFDPVLLLSAIENNPHAQVVTNQTVYGALMALSSEFTPALERVFFPAIKPGEQQTKQFNGISVHMAMTDHWGGLRQLNFEFCVDSYNVLFALEPDGYVQQGDIDLQFTNSFESDLESELAPKSESDLKVKYRVLTHQSGNDKKVRRRAEADEMANAGFLMHSGEQLELFRVGDDMRVQ